MTSSQRNTFLSDVLSASVIPAGKLAYFRGRLSNRFHALILEEFARLEAEGQMTRADLARRISREPAQISRWLGTPSNWTLDTISDLLIGMGYEPGMSLINLRQSAEPVAATASESSPELPSEKQATSPESSPELPALTFRKWRTFESFAAALAPSDAMLKPFTEASAQNDEAYEGLFGPRTEHRQTEAA